MNIWIAILIAFIAWVILLPYVYYMFHDIDIDIYVLYNDDGGE